MSAPSPDPVWTHVDDLVERLVLEKDAALEATVQRGRDAGLPEIQVSPAQGGFLGLLVRLARPSKVLEVGTLGGYSALWMARALPEGGRLVTLEADPGHAEVARRSLEAAGVADRVEVREGRALDLLPRMVERGEGPFDLVFLDAEKTEYPQYLDWTLRLSRAGTAVVADNVVRGGAVVHPTDPRAQGVRTFLERLGSTPGVAATVLQTVGRKGYDGFALAIVLDPAAATAAGRSGPKPSGGSLRG